MVYIYALFDPRKPEEMRYVGKTHKKLKDRICNHVYNAKKGIKWHVYNWIRHLWDEGQDFSYKVIEVCNREIWSERECYWIDHYKKSGHKLTNKTAGGEGTPGRICSEETKARIGKANKGRQTALGRVLKEETKKKISENHIGITLKNSKVGVTGYKYVSTLKGKYRVCIPNGDGTRHIKLGFLTPEEANDYVQKFLKQLGA